MAGDIFTLDADNNAVVRTVPVNAASSETNSPVIFTTDEDGNTAVRTVSVNAGASETNSPVIFTTDENGNAAVRVVGAGGGSTPVIDELNVTPSPSAQTITAPSGTDGYSPVNVSAVTSAIDANIVAGNIKKDVEILGVTGSYEGQTPTGTINITSNGTHDVSSYANADVQVPGGGGKYQLLQRVKDDSNNEIGSVCGFIRDSNNTEYAVVYLDRTSFSNQYFAVQNNTGTITDLPTLDSPAAFDSPDTATENCNKIKAYFDANNYENPAISAARQISFVINNITYYGQIPTIAELELIYLNRTKLNTLSTGANIPTSQIWSSTQSSATNMWSTRNGGIPASNSNKYNLSTLLPIIELPNA